MSSPVATTTSIADRFKAQASRRRVNNEAQIDGTLVNVDDDELEEDVRHFAASLPGVDADEMLRAVQVARDIHSYMDERYEPDLPERLTAEEKEALKAEREKTFSQNGMVIMIVTVALAALLQGSVQASINAASVLSGLLNAPGDVDRHDPNWKLGGMNSIPYFLAAVVGAPLSLPLNYWMGRRGAIAVACALIFASSLASAFVQTWYQLLGVRVVNGVGMGIKAVSTPILASETAVDRWRGSSILMWQLWVACGIMMGNAVNLVLAASAGALDFKSDMPSSYEGSLALRLILAAPMIPSLLTMIALSYCMESPRFYMQRNTPSYRPIRAYEILSKVRNTQLQALRDTYLIHKNIELEAEEDAPASTTIEKDGLTFASHIKSAILYAYRQYAGLTKAIRLRNAVWSTCTVALAQQLCGINVFAFYSNDFFIGSSGRLKEALIYSFGAVNFFFGLLAIRSIDNFGRRRWLLVTLPLMSLFLAGGALAFLIPEGSVQTGIVALFIFLFAAVYSPGLGPIPFTLASESFPLSRREAGCSVAISVNLFFAGLLTVFFPWLNERLKSWGSLVLFSGLNMVAFAMVFSLVEETKQFSLEDLSLIYAVPKRHFVRFQIKEHLPYLVKRYLGRNSKQDPPNLYSSVVRNPSEFELGDLRPASVSQVVMRNDGD
ncbi:putative polyol transporter 1 [Colletotrichum spinosum]|uniref:Putative polyol transporter 1 n=1 Tax=Colletotrichum spinosum TaxID=1347390 RepID=A0A4R8Q3C2_9PEZI|nr:putative polyol transporter 1 [Colletotrichum spinosum]